MVDENALNAMREDSFKTGARCVVGAAASKLTGKDRATFEEAMFGPAGADITALAISEYAAEHWGWSMHVSTLRVHRRGACTCAA